MHLSTQINSQTLTNITFSGVFRHEVKVGNLSDVQTLNEGESCVVLGRV